MPDRFGEIPIQPPQQPSPKKRAKKPLPPAAAKPANDKAPARIRVWGWTIFVVVIFALYSCLGFLGVPYYLSEILPKKFYEETGMVLEPNGIKFNPLTFRLESEKVQILSGSPTPILSLSSFVTDLAPLSLLRRDLVSNTVTIDELYLNLVRELDGSYNVQKLLGDKKVSNVSKIMDFSDLPFFFSLNNITIRNSRIIFNDLPAAKTHTIENIQLALPTFSNIPFQADQYLRPRFSAVIEGSPVELTGHALLGESDDNGQPTNLSCEIHNLNLSLYSDYLPFALPFQFNKGKADGKIELNFNPQEEKGNKLSIGFQLQISEAELQSDDQLLIVTVPAARVSGKLQPVSRLLVLENIALRGPIISSYGESFSQNINHMLQQKEHSKAPDTSKLAPFHLITDLVIVDDGTLRLFKERQDSTPATIWNSLQLSVKNYTTKISNNREQNNGTFRISGEQEGTSSYFSWQGTLPTPESLKGALTLIKFSSNDLLEATGEAHSFQMQGLADLKGQLSINLTEAVPPTINYKLTDTEISIEDCTLINKEKTIIEAPLVKIQGLNFKQGVVDFGNVYLKNSTAQLPHGSISELISSFSSGKYLIRGGEFDGKTILGVSAKDNRQLVFSNLTVKANQLNTPENTEANLSLSAKVSSGGIVKAHGYINLAPFSLSLTSGFTELPAKEAFSFFGESSFLQEIEGVLSGKGSFSLPKKSFAGEIELTNGTMETPEGSTFSWENSVFQNVQYTAKPFHLSVDQVEISHGDLGWQITSNDGEPLQELATFLQNILPEKQLPAKKRSTFSPIDIQEITFSNTKIHIQDHRLKPKWDAEIVDFAGKIQDIHSTDTGSTSAFTFSGEIDASPFAGQGEIDLFSKEGNGKVSLTLEKYPLASFHEQLSPWLDVNTSVGEFDLTLDSKWQEEQFHSSGFLVLTDIEPVSKTAQSALPLALLTGPDNTFPMNFDFSRSPPVGKTALFEEFLTLFQTLIVKGSVSPLLLAADDFTALIGNEFTEFKPGEFMLSDKGREALTLLTALLITHPYVGLELSGGIDKVLDGQAIKEQLEAVERKRVEDENKKLFKKWQTEKTLYETRLHELQNQLGPDGSQEELDIFDDNIVEFTPLQPEPVVIDETMLLELAQKRINVVYQHFITQLALEPDRITIAQPNALAADSDSRVNGVIITLVAIDR